MDLERRVTNLEDNVNHLRIDVTEMKTALKATAQQVDLLKLEMKFETVLPTLAKQADLLKLEKDFVELKTKFETILPHLVTKTWLAGAVVVLLLAQVFVPSMKDNLFFNFAKPNSVAMDKK